MLLHQTGVVLRAGIFHFLPDHGLFCNDIKKLFGCSIGNIAYQKLPETTLQNVLLHKF